MTMVFCNTYSGFSGFIITKYVPILDLIEYLESNLRIHVGFMMIKNIDLKVWSSINVHFI